MLPKLRLRRRDVVCQQAVELVTDYLEGALSRADRRRFEAHLAGCPHCTEYLAQMRATIELTGRITVADLTPEMQDEFIALYRQWRADGPPGSPGGPGFSGSPGGPGFSGSPDGPGFSGSPDGPGSPADTGGPGE